MRFRFVLAILLASLSMTAGNNIGGKRTEKSEKRKSMKIQLPSILSSRRLSDEPPCDTRASSVADLKGEPKVSFEQPNVMALTEKLQSSNGETAADCGKSSSQSDSSGSAAVMISLLPDSPVLKKRSLFRREALKPRATSGSNEQSETSLRFMERALESPRTLSVPQKEDQEEFSGSSQSSNISNFPSNENLSGSSQSVSSDVQHRQENLALSSISEPSSAHKRRVYKAGRKGSVSTSSIKKIEPIQVKRVGSTLASPGYGKPEKGASANLPEHLASKSSEDNSNQKRRKKTGRKKEKRQHESLEFGADVNLQLLIEQLGTTTAPEDHSRVKRRKPTRPSMKRRSLSLNNVPTRPPVVMISLAPQAEEPLENSIEKLIEQLNQSNSSQNRRSTQKKRKQKTHDSPARLGSSRERSAEDSPKKSIPRSPSKSKKSSRSKSRDPDFGLMIESLKSTPDNSVAVIAIDDEILELHVEEVPESKEIKRLIKTLQSSEDNEKQAAIRDSLKSLQDFETK